MQVALNKSVVAEEPVSKAARAQLAKAADEIVGSVFYGTMLRQMRSASMKGEYGHGGRGEEVFEAQLDQLYAKEMGLGKKVNLSDAIVDRFERGAIRAANVRERQKAALKEAQENLAAMKPWDAERKLW